MKTKKRFLPFFVAPLLLINCGGNFEKAALSGGLPSGVSQSTKDPALYPTVGGVTLAKKNFKIVSATESVDRYSITFNQNMDPATINSQNIYFKDLCDGTKLDITLAAVTSCAANTGAAPIVQEVTYDIATKKAYIDVTVDRSGNLPLTTVSLDEFVVTRDVKNTAGFGLMGDRPCSANLNGFCTPNDKHILLAGTTWTVNKFTSTVALPVTYTPVQACYTVKTVTVSFGAATYPVPPATTPAASMRATATYNGTDLDNTLPLDSVMATITVSDEANTAMNVTPVDIVNPVPAVGSTALTGSFDGQNFVVDFAPVQETGYNMTVVMNPNLASLCKYPDGTPMRATLWENRYVTTNNRTGVQGSDLIQWGYAQHDINSYTSVTPGVSQKYPGFPTVVVSLFGKGYFPANCNSGFNCTSEELNFPETMKWTTLNDTNIKAYTTIAGNPEPLNITIMNPDLTPPLVAPVVGAATPTRVVITSTDGRPINGIIITNGVTNNDTTNPMPMDNNNDGTTRLNPAKMTTWGEFEDYFYWGTRPLVP